MPAATSASSTSEPGPIRQRPTARPNASSRARYASGPTPSLTPTPIAEPPSCRDGYIVTTGIDLMAAGCQNTHQPPWPIRGQPIEAPHLGQGGAAEEAGCG